MYEYVRSVLIIENHPFPQRFETRNSRSDELSYEGDFGGTCDDMLQRIRADYVGILKQRVALLWQNELTNQNLYDILRLSLGLNKAFLILP